MAIRNRRRDPIRDGFVLAAILWCLAIAVGLAPGAGDARGWWSAPYPNLYVVTDYTTGQGWFFSPAPSIPFYPLTLLPWPVFAAIWTGIMLAALLWLTGRWAFLWLLVPVVWWEISASNIALLIGVAVVIGFRYPATWAFVLLTKVTPGIGLLWFLVRREWQNLAIAIGTTALIAGVSFVFAPGLWIQWVEILWSNAGNNGPGYFAVPLSLPIRLVLAAAIVTWGGLTNRRWTVVVAATLGTPVLWWSALSTLVAIVALRRSRSGVLAGEPPKHPVRGLG